MERLGVGAVGVSEYQQEVGRLQAALTEANRLRLIDAETIAKQAATTHSPHLIQSWLRMWSGCCALKDAGYKEVAVQTRHSMLVRARKGLRRWAQVAALERMDEMERRLHQAEADTRAARREADEWRRQAEAHASELLAWRRSQSPI